MAIHYRLTGWSSHVETEQGNMVITVQDASRESAATRIQKRIGIEIDPRNMSQTVMVAKSDFGHPLSWAFKEIDLVEIDEA